MSAPESTNTSATAPALPDATPAVDLAQLRLSILTRLALAIDSASQRLQSAATGQSVFASDADLKAALALLKLLPDVLALLPKPRPSYGYRLE